ncbi:hypothetical protein OSTOST_21791, partial [Ostertagia ostertagi]
MDLEARITENLGAAVVLERKASKKAPQGGDARVDSSQNHTASMFNPLKIARRLGTAMNLYTPGEGLLDIEEDMQRELSTTASFGPNKSVKDIGEGNGPACVGIVNARLTVYLNAGTFEAKSSLKGFMSKILLIDPDWQGKDKELPEKFLAK